MLYEYVSMNATSNDRGKLAQVASKKNARSSWYMEVSHVVHRAAFCGCNSAFYKSVVVSKNVDVENFEMIQFHPISPFLQHPRRDLNNFRSV